MDAPVGTEPAGAASAPASAASSGDRASSGHTASPEDPDSGASSSVRLAFCGDIYLSNYVLGAYDAAGAVSGILDERLLAAGKDADLFIANEEFPFGTAGEAAPDKQFTFRVDPGRCRILKELGVDLVTLANNHTLDYGRACLSETFDTLEQNGIAYMGAGADIARAEKLMTCEVNGVKLGFLAASRVIPDYSWNASETASGLLTAYDPARLLAAVRQLGEGYAAVLAGEAALRSQLEKDLPANAYLVGNLSHPDLSALLSQASAFCLPTRSEGFCTSLLEAGAWGVPCVVPDVGGAREVRACDHGRWDSSRFRVVDARAFARTA